MGRLVLLAPALLAACGVLNGCQPAGAEANPPAPLASVNGVDIRPLAPAGTPVEQSRLDAMIDTQLLQEAALQQKLDRDPLVQQAMARASSDILAQAYLHSKAAALAAPTRDQIDSYLAAHADAFAERKLFDIEQLVLASDAFTPKVKQAVDRAASLAQVAGWLEANGVAFTRARLVRHGSELPAPLLARLKNMRQHQLFVVVAGPQTTIDVLRTVAPDPVPPAQALAQADTILRDAARARLDRIEIARLRSSAKIAYFTQQQGGATATLGALRKTSTEKQ